MPPGDIDGLALALREAVRLDDEKTAVIAALELVLSFSKDIARIADALELIAMTMANRPLS